MTNLAINKGGKIQNSYPAGKIETINPKNPLNIIWLVSESWRADTFTDEIMPNTVAFAKNASRFDYHYSGGNGTRMGMFTQFYSLYGNYWFPFLSERKGPVLFDVLQIQDYQFSMYTSAKFTYPEFDKTIFSSLPKEVLH